MHDAGQLNWVNCHRSGGVDPVPGSPPVRALCRPHRSERVWFIEVKGNPHSINRWGRFCYANEPINSKRYQQPRGCSVRTFHQIFLAQLELKLNWAIVITVTSLSVCMYVCVSGCPRSPSSPKLLNQILPNLTGGCSRTSRCALVQMILI